MYTDNFHNIHIISACILGNNIIKNHRVTLTSSGLSSSMSLLSHIRHQNHCAPNIPTCIYYITHSKFHYDIIRTSPFSSFFSPHRG